jgi:hypothetical protein
MASFSSWWMTGLETGDFSGIDATLGGTTIVTAPVRSGQYAARVSRVATAQGGFQNPPTSFPTAPVVSQSYQQFARFFVYLDSAWPNAANMGVCGFGMTNGGVLRAYVQMDLAGHVRLCHGNGNEAYSVAALALDAWYQFDFFVTGANWDGSTISSGVCQPALTVYDANGKIVAIFAPAPFQTNSIGQFQWAVAGDQSGGTSGTLSLIFDDIVVGYAAGAVLAPLPTSTNIVAVVPTQQGFFDQFTPATSPALVSQRPDTGSVTANTLNASTLYIHATAAQVGAAQIQAIKLTMNAIGTGGAIHAMLLGTTEYPWTVSVVSSGRNTLWTPYVMQMQAFSSAAFRFLQFGARVKTPGSALTVYGFVLEVLCVASPPLVVAPGDIAILIDGVPAKALVRRTQPADIAISYRLDNPSTMTCALVGARPGGGQAIEVLGSGGMVLFAGSILSVDDDYEELLDQHVYPTSCIDNTWKLNRLYPIGLTFTNQSISSVAAILIAQFAPEFSAYSVQSGLPAITIAFDGSKTLSECLSLLTAPIGGHWYVDELKDLHLFQSIATGDVRGTLVVPGPITSAIDGIGGPCPAAGSVEYALTLSDSSMRGQETLLGASTVHIATGINAIDVQYTITAAMVGNCVNLYRSDDSGVTYWLLFQDASIFFTDIRSQRTFVDTIPSASVFGTFVAPTPGKPVATCYPYGSKWAYGHVHDGNFHSVYIFNNGGAGAVVAPLAEGGFKIGSTYTFKGQYFCQGHSALDFYTGAIGPLGPASDPVVAEAVDYPGGPASIGVAFLIKLPADLSLLALPWTTLMVYASEDGGPYRWCSETGQLGGGWNSNESWTWEDVNPPVFFDGNTPGWWAASVLLWRFGIDLGNLGLILDPPAPSNELLQPPTVSTVGSVPIIENQSQPDPLNATNMTLTRDTPLKVTSDSSQLRTRVKVYQAVGDVPTICDDLVAQQRLGNIELDDNGNPTNGIREFPIFDSTLDTDAKRQVRGKAELQMGSMPIETLNYSTRDVKTHIGQTVHADFTAGELFDSGIFDAGIFDENQGVYGDFLIQSVDITQIRQSPEIGLEPLFTVTASRARYTLIDLLRQTILG